MELPTGVRKVYARNASTGKEAASRALACGNPKTMTWAKSGTSGKVLEHDPQTLTQTSAAVGQTSSSPAGPTKTPLLFYIFNENVSHMTSVAYDFNGLQGTCHTPEGRDRRRVERLSRPGLAR